MRALQQLSLARGCAGAHGDRARLAAKDYPNAREAGIGEGGHALARGSCGSAVDGEWGEDDFVCACVCMCACVCVCVFVR